MGLETYRSPKGRCRSMEKPAQAAHFTLRFSADVLPLFATSSYSTRWPSLRVDRPALSTAEMWTKTSLPPPCGLDEPVAFGRVERLHNTGRHLRPPCQTLTIACGRSRSKTGTLRVGLQMV